MLKKISISNILGLQIFQVMRFLAFLIISIVFTHTDLSKKDIGNFELLLFIASAITFFWITGIIQSLLPLFNNNQSFVLRPKDYKSPELFNAFVLITIISVFIALLGFIFKNNIQVYREAFPLPYATPLLLYILFSSPSCLVEYVYLLYNKANHIIIYGLISFTLQVFMVILPIEAGYSIDYGIWGLVVISILRFLWLLVLLKKYAIWKISVNFIKEHLMLLF